MAEQNMFEHLQQLFASARATLRPILPKWLRGGVPIVPVVRLAGVIGFSTPLKPGLTLATVARALERAFNMRTARAVALLINSPGGSPVQSHQIYSRIRQLAAESARPVIAFAEDVAASGGYMIACAADEIFCDPSSIVGSIGVVGGSFGFPKLMDKLGVERRLYTSGEHRAGGKAIEFGLADGIGDLRATLRARFGDDVVTPLVAPARGWFGRVQPAIRPSDIAGLPRAADFAEEIISALEARALWARYGL